MIVKNYEKKENNIAVFQVEADAAEFAAAVNRAYLKNKSEIYIPGFRKGKAPRAVVEGMYGKEVFYQDAMDELAPNAFELGITENSIRFVGAPSITDVNVTEETTVVYTFSVVLYPEVTLGQYKGIEAVREAVVVSDEEVDAELESVRKRNSRKVSVEREAQLGDVANIDFEGFLEGVPFEGGKGENHDLELGSNSFVPGFEDQIVGMNIGEEKDLDITFPEEYVENLAGKAVVFHVKLNSLTVNELPELDDEFAKDVSEFDTLDEYKADLRATIEKRKSGEAENKFNSDVVETAVNNMSVEIPAEMINDKCEEIIRNYAANFGMNSRDVSYEQLCQMMGLNEEMINTNIRPSAERQTKQELLLEAVIKAEGLESTEEDVEAYLAKVAESVNLSAEEVKGYFGEEFIKAEQLKEKAMNVILESAVAKAE